MKILLVNPINKNTYQAVPDLGFGYLATALRKNKHKVAVLDCINMEINFSRFERCINSINPEVVGFKLYGIDLESAQKCIHIVKKCSPYIKIIIGGMYPSCLPDESLYYFPEVDFGFRGEAEVGLPLLLENLNNSNHKNLSSIPGLIWRNNGDILNNPPIYLEDLDSLDMPAWDLIDPREYNYQTFFFTKRKAVAPIIATRGCPYCCTFCSGHLVAGRKIRAHSVDYIIDEIKFLIEKFDIKEICFVDENLTANRDFLENLCNRIIKQKLRIDWSSIGIRLDLLDKNKLKLMQDAGCYLISVGLESGSQRILNHMQRKTSLEIIKEKLALIKDTTNIRVIGLFIIGYPIEEEMDIRKTIKFAQSLPLFAASFFGFHHIPGTPIYNELSTEGKIKLNWHKLGIDRKPYIPQDISSRKFLSLYRWAYISFYCRPKILFNLLINICSFSKLNYLIKRLTDRILRI
jgi:radical SAM superfamily enzyme YgiQ (UPF0313 family)